MSKRCTGFVREFPGPRALAANDAGVDLYAAEDHVLKPGERVLAPTGIAVAIPDGHEGQVRPKSGLALKHGLSVVNTPGTVDVGYRGEVGVILINLGDDVVEVAQETPFKQLFALAERLHWTPAKNIHVSVGRMNLKEKKLKKIPLF